MYLASLQNQKTDIFLHLAIHLRRQYTLQNINLHHLYFPSGPKILPPTGKLPS